MLLIFRGKVPFLRRLLTAQWILVMKLTAALIFFAALHVSAGIRAQKITLTVHQAPLRTVFKEIVRQTGISVMYDEEFLRQSTPVTFSVRGASLEEVLQACLKGQPFAYSLINGAVLIRQKEPADTSVPAELSPPDRIDVKGRVVNEKGEPIPNATVIVAGTRQVTMTNEKGEFLLHIERNKPVLMVSSVGYADREILVNGKTEWVIELKTSASKLADVNVTYNTGYQSLPAERATGSFAQPDKVMYDSRVSTDVISRLDGITSGMVFSSNNGNTSKNLSFMQIRGVSTINAAAKPLIIVDNFPYDGDLNNINPNNIESVTVLKDAAASSIWGARAGNGVVVITTRKGRYNQSVRVDVTANLTVSGKPDLKYDRNFLNAADFIGVERNLFTQGYYNGDLSNTSTYPPTSPVVAILAQQKAGTISAADADAQINAFKSADYRDQLKRFFYRGMVNQQYNINLSGGGASSSYSMAAGYDNNLPNETGNRNNRITASTFGGFRLLKNLELSGGLDYVQSKNYNNAVGAALSGGGFVGGPNGKNLYPYAQFADAQGNPLAIVKDYGASFVQSATSKGFLNWQYVPLLEKDRNDNTTNLTDTRLRAQVKYTILSGLNIEGLYQYETGNSGNRNYYSDSTYFARNLINQYAIFAGNKVTGNNIPVGGILQSGNINYVSRNGRAQLNFNRTFSIHAVAAIAGVEAKENTGANIGNPTLYGYDPATDAFAGVSYSTKYATNPGGSSITIPGQFSMNHTINRFRSYFSNVSYSYKELYTISASGRIDQTNLFGVNTNAKSIPLWSVGGKWNASNEAFYHVSWLPVLDARVTYGYSGNFINSGAAYNTAVFYSGSANITPPYAAITTPGNPNLTWEKTGMLNIGIDFGTVKNILSGSLEYYSKKGSDLVGAQPLPSSTGFTSGTVNYANMKGSGVDLILNTKNITHPNFQWSTSFWFSYATDKVTNYNPVTASGFKTVLVGKPVNALYGYRWANLDAAGNPQGYDSTGKVSTDYNSLVNYSVANQKYVGRSTPGIFGGMRNTFVYKNLSLSFNLSYKANYYFLRTSVNYYRLFNSWAGNTDYTSRWQKPGDEKITNIPAMPLASGINVNRDNFYNGSETLATKGDHIRFQDIILSYNLDKTQWSGLPAKHLQLSFYANNLGIIWRANKYSIDPDTQSGYLSPKAFAFSLKASF